MQRAEATVEMVNGLHAGCGVETKTRVERDSSINVLATKVRYNLQVHAFGASSDLRT